jgi:RNA polymerase-binding transcription factor DksA
MNTTIYVRPNAIVTAPCRIHTVFGSGGGGVTSTPSPGVVKLGRLNSVRCNGFLEEDDRQWLIPDGEQLTVDIWYYPGGDSTTKWVADLAKWRESRRKHLTELFARRRARRERELTEACARMALIDRIDNAASTIDRADRVICEASGRSGGRARRRAVRARNDRATAIRAGQSVGREWIARVEEQVSDCCSAEDWYQRALVREPWRIANAIERAPHQVRALLRLR